MPDTERSLSALQALFADNQAGAISAQDLRDFLVSALGGYATIYVVDAAVPQAFTATPAKLTAFTTNGPAAGATPDHANDQITIGVSGDYLVEMKADSSSNPASVEITLALYKNGVAAGPKSICEFNVANETRHCSFAAFLTLNAGDVLTVFGSATANVNVTVQHATLFVKRIG